MADTERSLALFVDFENLALGFQGRRERFEIQRVLKRMVEKGKIVAKKAYADWGRYSSYTEALHEAAIELVEIPRRAQTGKNSADIRLCVDAMDLAYSKEHIDTFVVLSGDSDFSPLVSKLKELGKHVIGLGTQGSTSELLRDNCDEFIYYEDLDEGDPTLTATLDPKLPEAKRKAFALLLDSLLALRRENKEVLWSSMVKDTMKRKKPAFNETYHGYRSFSALLEDAQAQNLIELETDKKSGTYVVTRFGDELKSGVVREERPAVAISEHRERRPRRDRGGRDRGERGERRGRRPGAPGGPRRRFPGRDIAVPAPIPGPEVIEEPDEPVDDIDLPDFEEELPSYGEVLAELDIPEPGGRGQERPRRPEPEPQRPSASRPSLPPEPPPISEPEPEPEPEPGAKGGFGTGIFD